MRTLPRTTIISAAVILVIAAVLLFLILNNRTNNKKTDDTKQTSSSKSTNTKTSNDSAAQNSDQAATPHENTGTTDISSAVATTSVTIQSMTFTPQVIKVAKGATVTWLNKDDVQHTVTMVSGDGPKSQPLENGDSYSYTFSEAGTYKYECLFHTSMTGTIIVE